MLRGVAVVWMPVQNLERRGSPVVTFQPEESLEEAIDNLKGRGRGPRRYLRSPLGSRGDLQRLRRQRHTALRAAYQDAGDEDERAAKNDLQRGHEEAHVE